jgi:cbb3-type cytochrome oxidase maturation protein
MSVIWILVGFSIAVAAGFLVAFIWAVRSGQYDDKYTPSVRILFEEDDNSSTFEDETGKTAERPSTDGDGNDQVR